MKFFTILSYLLIIGVTSSFLGSIHPIFDSISVFRQYLTIPVGFSLIISCYFRQHLLTFISIATITISLISTFPLFQSENNTHLPYSLYQKNLSFRLKSYDALIADIRKTDPDFITLQEVTTRHKLILRNLQGSYPYQHHCNFGVVGGVAILSKIPFEEKSYACLTGSALAKVQDKDHIFWLISIHLHWPWPYQQDEQLKNIVSSLSKLEGHKVVAGDFNTVKWSVNIREMNKLLETKSVKETNFSFYLEDALPIAIDQVLLPKNSKSISSTRQLLGSDHKGIYAEFLIEDLL